MRNLMDWILLINCILSVLTAYTFALLIYFKGNEKTMKELAKKSGWAFGLFFRVYVDPRLTNPGVRAHELVHMYTGLSFIKALLPFMIWYFYHTGSSLIMSFVLYYLFYMAIMWTNEFLADMAGWAVGKGGYWIEMRKLYRAIRIGILNDTNILIELAIVNGYITSAVVRKVAIAWAAFNIFLSYPPYRLFLFLR